jgi:hypothetical protein
LNRSPITLSHVLYQRLEVAEVEYFVGLSFLFVNTRLRVEVPADVKENTTHSMSRKTTSLSHPSEIHDLLLFLAVKHN